MNFINKLKSGIDNKNNNYINDLEIRIFALRRSGSHGIINWLGAQALYKPHFFNNASNEGNNPFLTGKHRGSFEEGPLKNIWYPHPRLKYSSEEEIEKVKNIHKEILIYNYETLDLKKLIKKEYPHNRKNIIGESKLKIDILILRDFVNWLVSKIYIPERKRGSWDNMTHNRFKKNRKELPYFNYYHGWEKDAKEIRGINYINIHKNIKIWIGYAKEFLEETNILENLITINYNKWHIDSFYRKTIIEKLPYFKFTDKGKGIVSKIGGGSTFQKDEKNADNLFLFDRWKYLENNRIFRDIIRYHVNCLVYNNIIFGENIEFTEWAKQKGII